MRYFCKFLLPLFVMVCVCITSASERFDYAIFMDAGSTGTRMLVVKCKSQQKLDSSVPQFQEIYTQKMSPGLSSYANHPSESVNGIQQLLSEASRVLRKESASLEKVKLYIFATAGMRLLDKEVQNEIFGQLNSFISEHYPFSIQNIETISGQDEGLYAWLEVNYLLSNFSDFSQLTYGIVDMGGASTQIAFEAQHPKDREEEQELCINKKKYTVFVKSFLGLGLNASYDKMNAHSRAIACVPSEYDPLNGYIQQFDYHSCHQVYTDVILDHGITPGEFPHAQIPFMGLSGLYYTYEFFGARINPSHSYLTEQINSICHRLWPELDMSQEVVSTATHCARGVYLNNLIYHFYNISQLTPINVIEEKSVGWMRGALLYHLFS